MSDEPVVADVVVVGSGAAGLTCAIALAERLKVLVLSKADISAGSTAWAQGGIAAVLDEGDTFEAHIEDTMIAGCGLNDRRVVEFVVEQAPAAIERLAALGVPFTPGETVSERFHLTREGGHRARRIVHVDDATGWAVQKALERAALANPNIRVLTDHVAIDIATERHAEEGVGFVERRAHGLYALDRQRGVVRRLLGRAVVLATGGASRVYRFSTNPDGATGDGIAMAWRAGCRVSNMEFNQFHPTCLYDFRVKNFLITEALRGEGGILRLPDGRAFMADHDPRAELAPRDIVARAIDAEMKRLGLDHVFLDLRHLGRTFLESHFPTIVARLKSLGIDPAEQPVPVVPAAHYTCGGVLVDRHGRTDLPGLYAIGEVSQSGLHGANRIASNSLLECLVFGASAADDILARFADTPPPPAIRPWDESRVTDSDEEVVVSHNWAELRRFMWDYVGIVRTDRRLERAARRVALLRDEVDHYYGRFRVTPNLLELRNVVEVADLIVRSAQARKESRGLHFSTDYPGLSDPPRDTILYPSRP
ncbi:MAG: L-aspartate oxidase [Sphingomonadaceae bacterium]|uniref:L-aspartate oxidase n=1 Tax=Thermaurantiacus sp. TaxID=2820283 RepID=UPI00298F074C|nr:L-aspartate oxidase [Thermaurantiacus sp.]MCS6987630.1 L-aspartate oxidase [Sphingomonadaceae bacterium]MDW8415231.1 L-aspartate oxidase [Thermaurantiacus sp.]